MSKIFSEKPPRPSVDEVNNWLKKWEGLEGYVPQDKALNKLFLKTYPLNKDIDDVLIKVCALNHFYSTGLRGNQIFTLARHIVDEDNSIDDDLKNNSFGLVKKIASGHGIYSKKKDGTRGDNEINYYSFATKYCANHKPEVYPIYDSYVEKMLLHFKDEITKDGLGEFDEKNIRNFEEFIDILVRFKNFYGLNFSLRDIDKYLWQAGKEYFPKNYSKKIIKVDKQIVSI